MLTSFLRILIIYPLVIFSMRLMGKRQIGELQPTELVVTIIISNIATLPLEDQNLPLLLGILPILAVISFEVLLSWLSLRHPKLRHLLLGSPQVIIRGGEIDQKTMENLRFSLDDLMTALRGNGIFDVREVQYAVMETNGKLSAMQKDPDQPAAGDPPEVLIADGMLCPDGMQAAGISGAKLQKMLSAQKITAPQVFLMTADSSGICCLVRKEDMQ